MNKNLRFEIETEIHENDLTIENLEPGQIFESAGGYHYVRTDLSNTPGSKVCIRLENGYYSNFLLTYKITKVFEFSDTKEIPLIRVK